jgi:hypothetical protein
MKNKQMIKVNILILLCNVIYNNNNIINIIKLL